MLESYQNKMIDPKDIKEGTEIVTKGFFYPDYSITIQAETQEEADKKLAEFLATKDNLNK